VSGEACSYAANSFCIPASGLNNDYACVPKASLVNVLPGCKNAFFVALKGCFAEVGTLNNSTAAVRNNSSRRSLRKRRSRGDRGKGTPGKKWSVKCTGNSCISNNPSGKGNGGAGDDDDDGGIGTGGNGTGTGGNGTGTGGGGGGTGSTGGTGGGNSDRSIRFQVANCNNLCISVNEFVCVNAKKVGVLSVFDQITESTGYKAQVSSLFTIIPIDQDTGTCIPPTATCVPTGNDQAMVPDMAVFENPAMAEILFAGSQR